MFARNNPIYRTELLHRQRDKTPRRLNVLSGLTLMAVLPLFTVHQDTVHASYFVMLVLIVVHSLHFIVSFMTFLLAYDSVMREEHTQTWDLLRITPFSIWTLVAGKTRAVLGWMSPLYIRLIGLKLALLVWQLAEIRSKAHMILQQYPLTSPIFHDSEFIIISAAALLFVIVYLLVDMLFTTALGIGVALVMPAHWRRLGLGLGLLVRWCLPVLTLASLLIWQFQGVDPLPTQWNTHLSMAARYTERYGFNYVGISGAVEEVFPSLAVTVPDGPLLVFMHTTATYEISTLGVYFAILLCSLIAYLGLTLSVTAIGQVAARLRYR